MAKTYYGRIERNPENPNEPLRLVTVAAQDITGHTVEEYDLKPANRYIGIPDFNGYAWGYSGTGPSALAEAMVYDYTHDPEKALKYRSVLIRIEIRWLESDRGFILSSEHVEAAMRSADREQEERERQDRRQQLKFNISLWRRHPMLALDALSDLLKYWHSEYKHIWWAIGIVVALVTVVIALVWSRSS